MADSAWMRYPASTEADGEAFADAYFDKVDERNGMPQKILTTSKKEQEALEKSLKNAKTLQKRNSKTDGTSKTATSSDVTGTTDTQTERSNRLHSADEVNPVFDTIRNLPEWQAGEEGDGEIERMISMTQGMPQAPSNSWVKPLLALADSQTGSKLLAGYTEPDKDKTKLTQLIKYKNDLEKRKNDRAQMLISAIPKFQSGVLTNVTGNTTRNTTGLSDTATTSNTAADSLTDVNQTSETSTKGATTGSSSTFKNPDAKAGKGETNYFTKKANTDAGEWFAAYNAAGGSRTMEQQLSRIKEADKILRKSENDLFAASGPLNKLTPDAMKSLISTKGQDVANLMSENAFKYVSGLKGAQSDKEGAWIKGLTYDEAMTPKQNIAKFRRTTRDIENELKDTKARISYAEKNKGIVGKDVGIDAHMESLKAAEKAARKPLIRVSDGSVLYAPNEAAYQKALKAKDAKGNPLFKK